MLKKRFTPILMILGVAIPSTGYAGYDFEPPSLRALARYCGVGPGPGYHSTPCPPHLRWHYRRVTNGWSPVPMEPDYRPQAFSAYGAWEMSSLGGIPQSGTTWPTMMLAEPTPATPPHAQETRESETRPPSSGQPRASQPAPRTTPPSRSATDGGMGSLIDRLLEEQEERDGIGSKLLEELNPPSPSDRPTESLPEPRSAARSARDW